MDVLDTWELFDRVGSAVAAAVAGADRSVPGSRPGQYGLDLDADAVAVQLLNEAGFAVMSEESGRHEAPAGFPEGASTVCVVVDPVDGSTNASRGLPSWAVSLCAVDDHGPLVASVIDMSRGVTYRASRGGGATRNGETIGVAAPVAVGESVLGLNGWSETRPACRQFRALGCASIELCLVAEGALDGYLNLDVNSHGAWDYLGGLLVLREAGGVAADVGGRELVTTDPTERRTIAAASSESLLAEVLAAMMSR